MILFTANFLVQFQTLNYFAVKKEMYLLKKKIWNRKGQLLGSKKGQRCHKYILNEVCNASAKKGRCSEKEALLAIFLTAFIFK